MSIAMRAISIDPTPAAIHHEATHRHTTHEHEHEFEPQRGLPEPLPANEHVLWQGAPDWRMLARECFHVRKLTAYFSILVAWRVVNAVRSGLGIEAVLIAAGMAIGLALVALGLANLLAWLSARTTLYTITDRRVVMRVGIVLSVTFNLPFKEIEAAGLHALPGEHGDIALTLAPKNRIAYLHLWPHVRPWRVARTQPNLRSIADAAVVARTLTAAWRSERSDVASMIDAAHEQPTTRPATTSRPTSATGLPDRSMGVAQAA